MGDRGVTDKKDAVRPRERAQEAPRASGHRRRQGRRVEEGRRRREGEEGRHLQARGEVRRRVQAAGERCYSAQERSQEGELHLRASGGEAGLCYSHQRYYWYVAEGQEDPAALETEAAPLRRLRQAERFHDQDAAARRTVHRVRHAQL